MFGWNALALALKGQDIYSTGCAAEREGQNLFVLHIGVCVWHCVPIRAIIYQHLELNAQ